jgi:hypothetical protein
VGSRGRAGYLCAGDTILPPPTGGANPTCKNFGPAAAAWTTNPANSIEGVTPHPGELEEMAGACDESRVLGRGMSLFGVGFIVNPDANVTATDPITHLSVVGMQAFAQLKLNDIVQTVTNAQNINTDVKTAIQTGDGYGNLKQIQASLSNNDYGCAAYEAYLLDQFIQNDGNPASDYQGDPNIPNPWGDIRGRLANLYLTLQTRLNGQVANTTWPPAASSSSSAPLRRPSPFRPTVRS